MDYTEYFLEQAIHGDGPPLTDHGPATPDEEQARRRAARRDTYRAAMTIDTDVYLDSLTEYDLG